MTSYTNNVPVGSNPPRQDRPAMTANTQYLALFGNKDHNFSGTANGALTDPDGYHKVIHFVDQASTTPAAIAGTGQLYTNTVSGDQVLIYESGAGVVTQLTSPAAATLPVRAFASFNANLGVYPGTVSTYYSSLNINTITISSSFLFTVSFTTALPSSNYMFFGSASRPSGFSVMSLQPNSGTHAAVYGTSSFQFYIHSSGGLLSAEVVNIMFLGG